MRTAVHHAGAAVQLPQKTLAAQVTFRGDHERAQAQVDGEHVHMCSAPLFDGAGSLQRRPHMALWSGAYLGRP
jgi:hypothetical protein